MFVAGTDAHTTYSVSAIVNNAGDLVHGPERIPNAQVDSLENLLDGFRPVEVVVEAWPLLGPEQQLIRPHLRFHTECWFRSPWLWG